jgi:periplasmic divalent cation tolerance protein
MIEFCVIKSRFKLIVNFLNYGHLSVTMKPIIIISTYPNKKSITKIGNDLIKSKVVACINISKISSIYSWQGKIENTSEYLVLFKTIQKNKKSLKEKIKSTHPYKTPEIIEIDIASVDKSYLQWMLQSTN